MVHAVYTPVKLSFKTFMEGQFVDPQATTGWTRGPDDTDPGTVNFPDFETYKNFKSQEDPGRADWTDMQWMIQYHFDRSQAQSRVRTTKPQANRPTPSGLPS